MANPSPLKLTEQYQKLCDRLCNATEHGVSARYISTSSGVNYRKVVSIASARKVIYAYAAVLTPEECDLIDKALDKIKQAI